MDRKFERTVEQKNPTNTTGNINQKPNDFDIDADTIREKRNKK